MQNSLTKDVIVLVNMLHVHKLASRISNVMVGPTLFIVYLGYG